MTPPEERRIKRTPRYWLRSIGALALASGMMLGVAVPGGAQGGSQQGANIDLGGSPVSLHDGSCGNPIIEPEFEVGSLESEPFNELTDDLTRDNILDNDLDNDGVIDTAEEGFLDEDLDNDGVLDDGEGIDGDGVIDAGFDEDGDGVLDENEVLEADSVVVAVDYPTVWKTEEEVEASFEELFGSDEDAAEETEDDDALDDPGVIAVHESSANFGNIVACADLSSPGWDERDELVVGFQPVNQSGVYGYAVFQRDTGNVPIFGDNTTGVTVYVFQNVPTLRDNLMTEATPTP